MKILLTIAFMDGFHGAVMHIRDLAGFFKRRGDEVCVATIFMVPEIKEIFANMEVPLKELSQVSMEEPYDIVFAYHYPTIGCLLKQGLRCKKLVLGSLSGEGRMETFPIYWESVSLLTVMSKETGVKHSNRYGIPLDKMYVLENPIPNEFAEYDLARTLPRDIPGKIAVVSNHVPAELKTLSEYLDKKVEITYYGKEYNNYLEMKPEILGEYDVVITIGKTIQYAMGLGICAFEYDWFGGCGYITPQNMAAEANINFSGRLIERKISTQELAEELLAAYAQCRSQLNTLKELACERFLLSNSMGRLLKVLEQTPDFEPEKMALASYTKELDLIHDDCFVFWTGMLHKKFYKYQNDSMVYKAKVKENYDKLQDCWKGRTKLWNQYQAKQKELASSKAVAKGLEQELEEYKAEQTKLKQELEQYKAEKNRLQKDLQNIKGGLSFRLGRMLTAIPRLLLGKK